MTASSATTGGSSAVSSAAAGTSSSTSSSGGAVNATGSSGSAQSSSMGTGSGPPSASSASGASSSGSTGGTGTPDAGSADGGSPDAGPVDAGPPDAGLPDAGCTRCSSGACLPDGGCGQCLSDSQCAAPNPRCNPATLTCVACLPGSSDNCPAYEYCGAALTCVAGCKDGAACASGVCLASHDCSGCAGDQECIEGQVCQPATGVCSAPCTAGSCGTGLTCCSRHCVNVSRDINNCGGCGLACTSSQFCSGTACVAVGFPNVCGDPQVTILEDGLGPDDIAAGELATTFSSGCTPPPQPNEIWEADSGLFETDSGRPLAEGGDLLAVPGGPYGQAVVSYFEGQGISPVYFSYVNASMTYMFIQRDGGAALASATSSQVTSSHDDFVVELVRDPVNGTLALITYGFGGTGTEAAEWYFANQILPMKATVQDQWFVVEWTDQNGNMIPDAADSWAVLASGP